jgi:hypothetical protein
MPSKPKSSANPPYAHGRATSPKAPYMRPYPTADIPISQPLTAILVFSGALGPEEF